MVSYSRGAVGAEAQEALACATASGSGSGVEGRDARRVCGVSHGAQGLLVVSVCFGRTDLGDG